MTTLAQNQDLLSQIAELAKACLQDKQDDMDTLQGSYKQKKWAVEIRQRYLKAVGIMAADKKRKAYELPLAKQASFWIELRDCTPKQISAVLDGKITFESLLNNQ
ncbi:hypothetical protein ACFBZI_11695 [Moraxella sp. ZJ142]|uniref:hypothetical protein n=1 Tax=Moraxella marmotae TaxID=3344520 RepID=UPI0035D435E1